MRPGNDPDNNNNEERKPFMTQKIVGRRDSKMRTLRMIGRSMLAGVAFSLAAVVVAVIAVPRVQARFGPVVPSGETTVTLGRDESTPSAEESGPSGESGETTGADSTGESGSEGTSPAETTAPEETVPVGEIVKAEIETWPFGMPEVLKLSYGLRGVADTADLSVVTIEQVREGLGQTNVIAVQSKYLRRHILPGEGSAYVFEGPHDPGGQGKEQIVGLIQLLLPVKSV